MGWATLFERADGVGTTVAEIRETLDRHREREDDGDA